MAELAPETCEPCYGEWKQKIGYPSQHKNADVNKLHVCNDI